jgi:hypothetical protein
MRLREFKFDIRDNLNAFASAQPKTERAGVNAVQALFDKCGYVFQPVALDNDFGKDAYVDLVHDRTSRNNGERTWGSTKKNELTDAG